MIISPLCSSFDDPGVSLLNTFRASSSAFDTSWVRMKSKSFEAASHFPIQQSWLLQTITNKRLELLEWSYRWRWCVFLLSAIIKIFGRISVACQQTGQSCSVGRPPLLTPLGSADCNFFFFLWKFTIVDINRRKTPSFRKAKKAFARNVVTSVFTSLSRSGFSTLESAFPAQKFQEMTRKFAAKRKKKRSTMGGCCFSFFFRTSGRASAHKQITR